MKILSPESRTSRLGAPAWFTGTVFPGQIAAIPMIIPILRILRDRRQRTQCDK